MVKILVFDTETSGLPPNMPGKNWEEREEKSKKLLSISDYKKSKSEWSKYISSWPSIIQLSYILYDTDHPEDAKIFNKYIDVPDDVIITEESASIHHITKESIAAVDSINRAKIYDALDEFMNDVESSNVVVGHNVQFDRKMVIAELTRVSKKHKLHQIEKMMDDSNFVCTMEKTQPVCNLKRKSSYVDKKKGEVKVFYKIKPPKLIESYRHYFGYEPNSDALHDALIDVVVCLRVYCMSLENSFDVCGTNPVITDYIMKISPPGYTCEQPVIETSKKSVSKKSVSKKSVSKKSVSKKSVSKRASSIKAPKKTKLSTIIEETAVKYVSSSKAPSQKSKSKTYRNKLTSKSKNKSRKNSEMSDFIVDDD